MYFIKKANPSDSQLLTDLAFRSKLHWGYGREFMDAFKKELQVSEGQIRDTHVYVAYDVSGKPAGFYAFSATPPNGELDFLFIAPEFIGQGCGNMLWQHMLKLAAGLGVKEIIIQSDPNATGFYKKQGAKFWKNIPSQTIKNRTFPVFKYRVF